MMLIDLVANLYSRVTALFLAALITYVPSSAVSAQVNDEQLRTLFVDEEVWPGPRNVRLVSLLTLNCIQILAGFSNTIFDKESSEKQPEEIKKCQAEVQNILDSQERNPSGLELKDVTTKDVAMRLSAISAELNVLLGLDEVNDDYRKLANYAARLDAIVIAIDNEMLHLNTRCDEVNEILTDPGAIRLQSENRKTLELFCQGTAINPDFLNTLRSRAWGALGQIIDYSAKTDPVPVTQYFDFNQFEQSLDQVENFDRFIDTVITQSRAQIAAASPSEDSQQQAQPDVQAAAERLQEHQRHLDQIVGSFDQKMNELDAACTRIEQLKAQAQAKQITLEQPYSYIFCDKTPRKVYLAMLKSSHQRAGTITAEALATQPNLVLADESLIDQFEQNTSAILTDVEKLQAIIDSY